MERMFFQIDQIFLTNFIRLRFIHNVILNYQLLQKHIIRIFDVKLDPSGVKWDIYETCYVLY